MSLRKIRSSRLLLCHCLVGALGRPLSEQDLPNNQTEWRAVLNLAHAHVVTPLLRKALQENDLLEQIPHSVLRELDIAQVVNLGNNKFYAIQLSHLIKTLNGIGVRPVLLKGAATLVGGFYPGLGDRFIGDIDVLVPPESLQEILETLQAVGYRPIETLCNNSPTAEVFLRQNEHHHYPPLACNGWPVAVELHVFPIARCVPPILTREELERDASLAVWQEGECLLPSPMHFVIHNIIHTFLVDIRVKNIVALRQVFEFVHFSHLYECCINWMAVRERFDAHGKGGSLRRYAALVESLLQFDSPQTLQVGRCARAWVKFYFVLRESPFFIQFVWRIIRAISTSRNFSNPVYVLKKALNPDFYVRIYRETKRATSQA